MDECVSVYASSLYTYTAMGRKERQDLETVRLQNKIHRIMLKEKHVLKFSFFNED